MTEVKVSPRTVHDESGQMAFLMVLSLPVVFIFMALAVDVGVWFFDHRSAQNQLDAAVLAAAQELPAADTTQATAAVGNWLTKNGSGPEDISCLDYSDRNGDGLWDAVKVCIERQSPGFFSRFSGIPFVTVRATGTAATVSFQTLYSFISLKNCPDTNPNMDFPGSNNAITGSVHSNCNFSLGGSDNVFDGIVTAVGDATIGGGGNTCIESSCATQGVVIPSPINYTFADVPCDYMGVEDLRSDPSYWEDAALTKLKDGVYCNETGKLTLSGGGVEGNVTFVAYEIDLSGADYVLTPYWNDILLFGLSDSPAAIQASGSGGSWDGSMYAPIGQVKISGSSGLFVGGTVIANEIVMSGSGVTVHGNIQGESAIHRIALIQ